MSAPVQSLQPICDEALEAATKAIYEDKGDRKGVIYVGWDNEPERVKAQWRVDVRFSIEAYLAARAAEMPDWMTHQPKQGGDKGEAVLWICLVGDPKRIRAWTADRKRIRAWTADRKRMESLRAEGLDMQPLYLHPAYTSEDVTPKMVSAGMAEIPEDGCEYEHVEAAYRAMRLVALTSTDREGGK